MIGLGNSVYAKAHRAASEWLRSSTEHIERAGGEQAVEVGKQELLDTVVGHRLAEVPRRGA